MTKPFGRQELLARDPGAPAPLAANARGGGDVHATRRSRSTSPTRVVAVDGDERRLTPLEFRLLGTFVRHANQVLSREQLLDLVWGDSRGVSLDQVKLYVGYLRRKLGGRGRDRDRARVRLPLPAGGLAVAQQRVDRVEQYANVGVVLDAQDISAAPWPRSLRHRELGVDASHEVLALNGFGT